MKRSVVVLAHGGLGNQLFQVAAASSLSPAPRILSYAGAWGSNHPTLADVGYSVTYPHRLVRTTVPGISMRESWKDDVSELSARVAGRLRGIQVVTQSHPFAERSIDYESGSVVLNGYFQHPTWWKDSWRSVAQKIADNAPPSVVNRSSSGPVIIKIRRSDYLGLNWALSAGWLSQAIEALDIAGSDVCLLGEDEETRSFAYPIIKSHGCRVIETPVLVQNPHLNDFWTLVNGRTIISANSSFSWWAAAVAGVLHDATVAYPDPWLPNIWTGEKLPKMGLPSWIPITETRFLTVETGEQSESS